MKKIIIFVEKKNKLHSQIVKKIQKKNYVDIIFDGENIKKLFLNKKYDYFFCLYSHIKFKENFISNSKIALNFHLGLPKYPGSCSSNWAIYNKENFHGITVHYINKNIDNGKILYVKKFKVLKKIDNVDSLMKKSFYWQKKVFFKIYSLLLANKLNSIKQRYKWGKKIYKKKDIKKLELIKLQADKKKIDLIVKSTVFKKFRPKIQIGKHMFEYILTNPYEKN
jgi:methionyl-tRNA formyltransferase